MAFTVVEWFVLAFSILAIVKILTVSFNPKGWLNLVEGLYKSSMLLFVAELVLAAILFYHLLREITIVQILAGLVLGALLTGMTFAAYGRETIDWGKKILKGKTLLNRVWLPLLVWLALSVWALSVIL